MKFAAVWMLAAMLVGPPTQAEDPQPPFEDAPASEPAPAPADQDPAAKDEKLALKIVAPTKAIIGELVHVKLAESGNVRERDWLFDPPINGKLFTANRMECYFSTPNEGVYTIDVVAVGKEKGIARARAKVEMAYAEGVKAKARPLVMKSSDPAVDIRQWASEIQTATRDRDVADLVTALNSNKSVSEAKGHFTTLAGARAAAWNPFFGKLESLMATLESQGKLRDPSGATPVEDYYRGALQSTAKALEAGQ